MAQQMVDPYRRLKPQKKIPRETSIVLIICGMILFTLLIVIMFLIPIREHRKFWTFMSNLSEDTTDGNRHESAKCTLDGETYILNTDEVYEVYQTLVYREDIDYFSNPGPVQPGIHIDYGNGSALDIWEKVYYDKEGNERTRGISVFYTGDDGRTYGFNTENIKYSSLLSAVKQH